MSRFDAFTYAELLGLQSGTSVEVEVAAALECECPAYCPKHMGGNPLQGEIRIEIARREHPEGRPCMCPVGVHEIAASGDTYTVPGSPRQTLDVYYCASGCGRQMCTASESGYSAHCCKPCAESQGHSERCNENHAWMSVRICKKVAA